MTYLVLLMSFCFVVGLIAVASNPSPYYGAAGLVIAAFVGCMVLIGFGGSFVSLILFLIYLGGMLVVFAYSVALASEPYPETWGNWSVFLYMFGYLGFVILLGLGLGGLLVLDGFGVNGVDGGGMHVGRVDFSGVALLYSWGGCVLLISGAGLLLTLFVVLELTRGLVRGSVRVV
uniref:NADH-ubiquinone oxidoreductase chain 6 n=1 Tax=Dibamus novaeguineae TaxID=266055 RepID=C6FGR6_9SAUR|nr:NADH dehydrogenase subunit 6 [Dibamus novaeguineae]